MEHLRAVRHIEIAVVRIDEAVVEHHAVNERLRLLQHVAHILENQALLRQLPPMPLDRVMHLHELLARGQHLFARNGGRALAVRIEAADERFEGMHDLDRFLEILRLIARQLLAPLHHIVAEELQRIDLFARREMFVTRFHEWFLPSLRTQGTALFGSRSARAAARRRSRRHSTARAPPTAHRRPGP